MPPQNKQNQKDLWNWNMTNHKPTAEAIQKIESLRNAAKAMKDAYIDLCPQGREQSLALTHLETAQFYAIAAIARRENEDVEKVDDTPEEDKHLAK